ncbi:MAG: hypothetical protein AB7E80_06490 [Hyphomicrobiaceae bacterium]
MTPAVVIAAVSVASAAVMTWSAHAQLRSVSLIAALAAGTTIAISAWHNNRGWLSAAAADQRPVARAGAGNAGLLAAAYAWGALAMLAVYMLSGLKWQHGWQYGSGMAMIAAGLMLYSRAVLTPGSRFARPRWLDTVATLSLVHGIGVIAGLGFLVSSGKLGGPKADWAANHVFVVGALTILVVTALSLITHVRLRREG